MKKLQLLFAGAALIAAVACGGNTEEKATDELKDAAEQLEQAIESEVENAAEAIEEAIDSTTVEEASEEEAPVEEAAE